MTVQPTTGELAVVIYVSSKPASSHKGWIFLPLDDRPAITYLVSRLVHGLGRSFRCFIACHDEVTAARIQAMVPCVVFASSTVGRRQMLTEFARHHPSVDTLAVFPENSAFCDCVLSARMIEEHRRQHADATFAPDLPIGLVPEIFAAPALLRADTIPLPADITADCLQLMYRANQIGEASPDMRFKILRFDARLSPQALAQLPSLALVHNYQTAVAAASVCNDPDAEHDLASYAARRFKQELIRLACNTTVPPYLSLPAPTGAIPVLFCSSATAFSGAEQSCVSLIAHLDRSQFHPFVVLRNRDSMTGLLQSLGIEVDLIQEDLRELTPTNFSYFERYLRDRRIKIVHIDSTAVPSLTLAATAARVPIVRHVRTFHGFPGLSGVMKFAKKWIAISDAVSADLMRSDIPPNDIVRIYNGVDLTAFEPVRDPAVRLAARSRCGVPDDAEVILMVARVSKQKRQDVLISAMPEILAHHSRALVLLVGEIYTPESGYFCQLLDLIQTLGIEKHIRFWGFEEDIRNVYSIADVLVLCTENEPLGRCILEALAMEVPVVSPQQGGHSEFLRHGTSAIQFDPRNSSELAGAICAVLEDKELRSGLVGNGREAVKAFEINEHVSQVQSLYRSLLSGRSEDDSA